jgi:hypothetical protein
MRTRLSALNSEDKGEANEWQQPEFPEETLKTLAMGVAGGGVLAPMQAAELAHQMVHIKSRGSRGQVLAEYFSARQYEAIIWLCDTIIPKDEKLAEPSMPALQNSSTCSPAKTKSPVGSRRGLMWLDNHCIDQYENLYGMHSEQRKEFGFDRLSQNAKKDLSSARARRSSRS